MTRNLLIALCLIGLGRFGLPLDALGDDAKQNRAGIDPATARLLRGVSGGSRDLNPPLVIDPLPPTNKPVVFIYYANETAPDQTERKNLEQFASWLRETGHPEITPHADSIEFDTRKFPRTVDEEIGAFRKQHAAAGRKRPSLVIFTNRLAQEGKFHFIGSDRSAQMKEGKLPLPKTRTGLYQAYPLASVEVFEIALKAAAAQFPADKYEYVLVTKSHGSGDYVVVPRYQAIAAKQTKDRWIATLKQQYAKGLKSKLANASPLMVTATEKLIDDKGQSLVEKDSVIFWEGQGRVLVGSDKREMFLTDRAGKPFTTAAGNRITVKGKQLMAEGSQSPILNKDGKPIELFAILARGLSLAKSPDANILPPSMRPQLVPVVKTKFWELAKFDNGKMTMPILEGDKATATILKGDKMTMPILDSDKATTPILDTDKATTPILDTDKATTPILDADKADFQILNTDKTAIAGLCDKGRFAECLGTDKSLLPRLDPDSNDTLGIGAGTMSTEAVGQFGISKARYFEVLRRQGDDGMVFRLVFCESCASELPVELLKNTKASPSKNVVQLWTSDSRGLTYTTIDYTAVYAALTSAADFTAALSGTLQSKYESERAASIGSR